MDGFHSDTIVTCSKLISYTSWFLDQLPFCFIMSIREYDVSIVKWVLEILNSASKICGSIQEDRHKVEQFQTILNVQFGHLFHNLWNWNLLTRRVPLFRELFHISGTLFHKKWNRSTLCRSSWILPKNLIWSYMHRTYFWKSNSLFFELRLTIKENKSFTVVIDHVRFIFHAKEHVQEGFNT